MAGREGPARPRGGGAAGRPRSWNCVASTRSGGAWPSALPLLNQASTTYRITTGPQAGRRIARIGGGVCAPGGGKPLCAEIAGFTLHAATRCRADDRHRLARLCRYVMRPAFADDQLRWDGGSRVSFELKTPCIWR
jgi:hypothetical protein